MKNIVILLFGMLGVSCHAQVDQKEPNKNPSSTNKPVLNSKIEKVEMATLAGGCFWCVEAALEQLKGVDEVISGYAGGTAATANYTDVSNGNTGHAEAVQVRFDPDIISFDVLLDAFFTAHDPTQLNRQGADVGTQYRSAIFFHNKEQEQKAKASIEKWKSKFKNAIVTEIVPLDKFYRAEEYHQDYQRKNPYQPYIMSVSKPKAEKVKKAFPNLIRE